MNVAAAPEAIILKALNVLQTGDDELLAALDELSLIHI